MDLNEEQSVKISITISAAKLTPESEIKHGHEARSNDHALYARFVDGSNDVECAFDSWIQQVLFWVLYTDREGRSNVDDCTDAYSHKTCHYKDAPVHCSEYNVPFIASVRSPVTRSSTTATSNLSPSSE